MWLLAAARQWFTETAMPVRVASEYTREEDSCMPDETLQARQVRLMEIEAESLHQALDKFDNSRFTIKNWAVTSTGAILALSVNAKSAGIGLIGFAVVPLFAYLEVLYMYIQTGVVDRIDRVEQLLDSTMRDTAPLAQSDYRFGTSQAFAGKFDFRGLLATLRGRPHIYALYLGLLAATTVDVLVLGFFS
jgi:hypothetical protein